MAASFDILIQNASLRQRTDESYDIGIRNGKVVAIQGAIDGSAITQIDAAGQLVTESFSNPHLHLCKAYTLGIIDEGALKNYHGEDMGKAMTAIELAAQFKGKYGESWIIKNVRKALALFAIHGGTHVRAFADVDVKSKLEGVKALIRAREEFAGIVDVQIVAFAQDGIVREPGAADLLRQGMKLGANVVGGIPWIEYTNADILEHVKTIFDIAEEFDAPISMLVDDAGDPGLRSLETMAVEAIVRGWQGRALAHHARAMLLYPKPYFQKVAALLNRAEMGIVSDPHTGPLHARVRELLEEGCLVSLGQDDISDAYYPYGRNSMLEVAFLASHLLWMMSAKEMETLYDMITTKAAASIGVANFELKVGAPANLVVLGQPTVLDALRHHEEPTHVVSHGRLVNREKMQELAATHAW